MVEADTKGSREIHNMLQNGNEMVSNIQVATENLYCQHRIRTEDKSKEITSILEEEDSEMIVKFKKIMSSWPTQVSRDGHRFLNDQNFTKNYGVV